MQYQLHIAWRYLFAKKRTNAINIVSAVSAAGVCVITAALVCVLSVMNGFASLVEDMFSNFDPQLRITTTSGNVFSTDTEAFKQLREMQEISVFSETLEQTGLIEYNDKQVPALIKGVDSDFQKLTNIDSIMFSGKFCVFDGAFYNAVLGVGLANQLGIAVGFIKPLHIYTPRRTSKVNMLRPDKSFNKESAFLSGIFTVQQTKYDDSYILLSLPLVRRLYDYNDNQVTAIELSLDSKTNIKKTQRKIQKLLGGDYIVADRYEQQQDFFHIMKIEKFLTNLLLFFILLIASFNIVGSLSMLIIDKNDDINTMRSLGANESAIRKIFLYEGWLISTLGAVIGLVIGLVLCLLQDKLGIIKLGNGTEYVISAYPVKVEALDLIIVTIVVLALGYFAAWIPTRKIKLTALPLLFAIAINLSSCNERKVVNPVEANTSFNSGYAVFYGNHYDYLDIPQNVMALSLFSPHLSVDTAGYYVGSGTHLVLTDIFVNPSDTILPAGHYTINDDGSEMTFLEGHDFDGNVLGSYMLIVTQSGFLVEILKNGSFDIYYNKDTTFIDFQFTRNNGKTYSPSFKGILPTYISIDATDN